jgi:hypothetical protein
MPSTFDPVHAAAHGYTLEDWHDVSDNPEWTDEDFARARPLREALPSLYEAIRQELEQRRLTSASSPRSSR